MDKIYGCSPFTLTIKQEYAQPIKCILLSARGAVFAVNKSYKYEWANHIIKFEIVYPITYDYVAIGFSPVSGKMIVVKEDSLIKHVNMIIINED